ncbi:MAG: hypothetical protein EZS28_025730, partial [Streblomastix strix]
MYNQSETAEAQKLQIQVTQQKESQLLTFCSYLNGTVIGNMKLALFSDDDDENSPNFDIHPKFDSHPLDHVTIQENSIKFEVIELIDVDFPQYVPLNLEVDLYTLTQQDKSLSGDLEEPVVLKFVNEVSIAMCNSSIIALFKLIFIAMLVRAIMTEFLPRKTINYKSQSQLQKKNCNKLVILFLIIKYLSFFEVAAETKYLSNTEFIAVASQNIVVDQPTDEFKVINCNFTNCSDNGGYGNDGALKFRISNGGKCYILNTTFINCTIDTYGGAVYAYITLGGELTIDGLCSFTDCLAIYYGGGGLYARIDGVNSKLLLEDGIKFERCKANSPNTSVRSSIGGAIYLQITDNGSFVINKVSCIDCESSVDGGGIYVDDISQETLKFNGTLFERCYANEVGGL